MITTNTKKHAKHSGNVSTSSQKLKTPIASILDKEAMSSSPIKSKLEANFAGTSTEQVLKSPQKSKMQSLFINSGGASI